VRFQCAKLHGETVKGPEMIPSLSIGPRTLLNDCNHSATAIFWRSALFNQSIRTISEIALIEYAIIILILTLSGRARSDFEQLSLSNSQSRVHVRGCGIYPNAKKNS